VRTDDPDTPHDPDPVTEPGARGVACAVGPRRPELGLTLQTQLVRRLRVQLTAPGGAMPALIETHISWVLVGTEHAYKLKKALRTPFLDQSTLALRQRACEQELRLNRRLAPDLYLAVVPVTGSVEAPALGDGAAPIDVAVKMRAFAQDALWDRLAARGELRSTQVDDLAELLAAFHASAGSAAPDGPFGSPAAVREPVVSTLDELDRLAATSDSAALLERVRRWEAVAFARLAPVMARRLVEGRVRECHGDLHLGNVTVIDGRTTVFDGIDFNDAWRWIDVISEIAFMAMDLHAHGLANLAHRFVNAYLELSGDYDGLQLLDYFIVHRALVRAKVALMRAAQYPAAQAAEAALERVASGRYLDLALRFSPRAQAPDAALLFTHGLSGSGKSTGAASLLEAAGAIRIRADVERKRLAGLRPRDRAGVGERAALYGARMTSATHERLAERAVVVLRSGYHVILDATFLQRAQRDAVRSLATSQGTRCLLLDFDADPDVLRRRVRERAARGADASDADAAVLAAQMLSSEPLQPDEMPGVFECRSLAHPFDASGGFDWAPVLDWLAAPRRIGT
jgi:aminoglycoside phosphotransferase family enzyme/predicted kinase